MADGDPLDRNDLSGTTADLATLDLYSCFPIAVFNITDGLGVMIGRLDSDPRIPERAHTARDDELDEIFDAYFADPDLWVAILTGAGTTAFSAGNDLIWTGQGKPMWVPKNGFAGLTSRQHLPKPVIAAVNGYAMGGGCEIAVACHLIVADTTATFALSEVRVGLIAGAGGLVRLPRLPRAIPSKLATEMILTGRRLTAEEALHHGLVNRVVRRRHRPLWSARPGRGNPRRLTDLRQSIPAGHGRDRWHPRHRRCHPAPIARTRTHCWSARTWSKASPRSLRKGHPTGQETGREGIRSGRSWVTGAVESVAALDTSAGPPGLAGGGLSGRQRTPEGSRRPV